MRTTLTLDDDVAVEIERIRATRNISLKQAINELLRLGILQHARPKVPKKPFRTKTYDLGEMLVDVTCISQALAIVEGEDYK